jgi:hypothetical protein
MCLAPASTISAVAAWLYQCPAYGEQLLAYARAGLVGIVEIAAAAT